MTRGHKVPRERLDVRAKRAADKARRIFLERQEQCDILVGASSVYLLHHRKILEVFTSGH